MNSTHDTAYSVAEHTDKISWLLDNVIQLPFAAIFLGFAVLGLYFAWRQWGKHTIWLSRSLRRNTYLKDLHDSLSSKQEELLYGLAKEYQSTKQKLDRREHHIKELHYRLALKEDQLVTYQRETNEPVELRAELAEVSAELEKLRKKQHINEGVIHEVKQLKKRSNLQAQKIAKLKVKIESEKAHKEVEVSSWEVKAKSLILDLGDRDRMISELREQIKEQPKKSQQEEPTLFNLSEIYQDDQLGVLYRSRPDRVDDLKELSGVADVLEEKLHRFGIYQFKQIATWTDAQIVEFGERLSFKDRIDRDLWVNQAIDLHYDKYEQRLTPQAAIYRKQPVQRNSSAEDRQINFRHEDKALAAFDGENVETHHRFGVVYTEAPTQADDLKKIKGVGKTLEKELHKFGVYRFKQIALWSPRVINEFIEDLPFGDRVTRDHWTEQASDLHEQKYGEKAN